MRIAFFLDCFPVISETFILRQITGLMDLGHEVEIFAGKNRGDEPIHPEVLKYDLLHHVTYLDEPRDACYWEMPVWPLTGKTWLPGEDRPHANIARALRALPTFVRCLSKAPRLTFRALNLAEYGYQAQSLSTLYRLAELCNRKTRYDVLHAHFGPVGNTFRFARELFRAALVVTFHGYDFCTLPRKHGTDMYRRLFETADMVTVNSDYTWRAVENLGCPRGKLCKLPVGLDPAEFPFHARIRRLDEPVRLLTVARLVEIKGHEYTLQAIARLRERHPAVRYDIVGEGPLRPKLEQLIRQLGLVGVVSLHGAKESSEVRRMMAEAHVFILCSVNVEGDAEGQGLVLQEAQACGLPVVATNHGAFPEGLLPDRSGFLVPERDVDALAERLGTLIERSDDWPKMGRCGRQYVEERYDIRELNRRLTGVYEKAVEAYRLSERPGEKRRMMRV